VSDPRLILLAPQDNCLIAATTHAAGTALLIEGETVVLVVAIPLGHKLARRALAADEKVLRYGRRSGTLRSTSPKAITCTCTTS
jgi:altronate dehydratase small subunit